MIEKTFSYANLVLRRPFADKLTIIYGIWIQYVTFKNKAQGRVRLGPPPAFGHLVCFLIEKKINTFHLMHIALFLKMKY